MKNYLFIIFFKRLQINFKIDGYREATLNIYIF